MPNPQTPKSYLAVTIGPIVKTLLLARKTRELWAASFLLSKLMEHLIYHLDPDRKHLLIPNVHSAIAGKPLYGAGIYSDKLYMEADHLSDEQIQAGIDMSFEALAKDLLLKQEAQDPNETAAAVSFWKQFLRVRYVKTALSDILEGKLSTELTPFLDNFELEDTLVFEEPARDYLLHLFEVKRIFNCQIAEALSNKGVYEAILGQWALFPSTHEIAAFELLNDESGDFLELSQALEKDEDDSEKFYLEIEADKSKSKLLKPRHKYFCIVQADGDNIGEAIKQLGKEQDYLDFSATLAAYGVEAATLINEYGGKPVYIGGDDLLFLAPVHTSEGSVFDLIEKLDKAFPKDKLHPDASLSFALNIVYYKFPLFEAIHDAYELLKKAKKYQSSQGTEKNCIAFRYTKHSGTAFEALFSKEFLVNMQLAVDVFEKNAPKNRTGIVSSLVYKLNTLEYTLVSIAKSIQKRDDSEAEKLELLRFRLQQTFEHFFNEWENEKGFTAQKNAVIELLIRAYQENEDWTTLFYHVMRVIQFIISPSETTVYDTENIAATPE